MHIAIISQRYPPETGGVGVATHNGHFSRACAKMGHQVTVVSSAGVRGKVGKTKIDGVQVIRISETNLNRYERLPLIRRQLSFVQALIYNHCAIDALSLVDQEEPVDVVEFADANAEGFYWRGGKNMVVRCHSANFLLAKYYSREELTFDPRTLNWAERRTIRRANLLAAPTQDIAQVISRDRGVPLERFHITPDALDTDQFTPANTPKDSSNVTILFVGRLERIKGIYTLIEAIPQVCDIVANVRFVIVGGCQPRPGAKSMLEHIQRTLADYRARTGRSKGICT